MSDKQANKLIVGFVGAGAMGGAIARGLCEASYERLLEVVVSDPSLEVRSAFEAQGVTSYENAQHMLDDANPDLVFLAVKPQVLEAVVSPLKEALASRVVVSIAAGVKLKTLEDMLAGARVVRAMPNLPMQVASGAVALAKGTSASNEDVELVQKLLEPLAQARIMREDQLDVCGIVCGSSPAFFALFVDALTRAGVRAGMVASDCREMVEATMKGTAIQLLESHEHPRELMERVSSPGGTTIAALRAMEADLCFAVEAGLDAALERTRELAGE